MAEDRPDYVTEAMGLLKGEPAAVIEQPRSRLVLREGLGEEWTVAWVKLSTAFKPHIKELKGSPLAVWLYISLSIGKNGVAFPAVRTIAEDTGYSHQGVLDAIEVLEGKGYLKVRRGERRFNLYEPEFAAIGRTNDPSETVNSVDSSGAIGKVLPVNRSTFPPNESSGLDLNKKNKKEQEIISPEFREQADRKVDAIIEQSRKAAQQTDYWQGRENIPPHLLKYADWWNKRTGQEMKGKVKADYLKEWTFWNNDELPLSALDEAFEYVSGWKSRQGGRVAHPREITKDAVGFAANPKREEIKPIQGGFYG